MSDCQLKTVGSEAADCLIEERVLTVERSSLDAATQVLAALDRGCTLTKLVFGVVEPNDPSRVRLHFALFKNADFSIALAHLKRHLSLSSSSPSLSPDSPTRLGTQLTLNVTGVGCDKYRRQIKEELGVDIQFVNEGVTHGRGFHWLMLNTPRDFVFYPKPERSAASIVTSRYVKSINTVNIGSEHSLDKDFPCILLSMGSGAGVFRVEENGTVKQECSIWFAGTTFLALGQALVGTDSYDSLLALAVKGDRSRVDMQVKEILANDPESPYGQFPGDAAIYSFAKMAGTGRKLSEFAPADLARSLVHAFANNTMRTVALAAKAARVSRALLGGNFFRHELVRTETLEVADMVVGDQLRIDFIRTGHTGAIGAMLSGEQGNSD